MIDPKCLGPDLDRSKISPDARIVGESYLTGPATCVAAGALVENSRLENVVVQPDAKVIDAIVTVDLPVKSHRCDATGRFIAAGTDRPEIGAGSLVQSSTLINSSVGSGSTIRNCWISNSHVGPGNRLEQVKMILCHAEPNVTLTGPTEFSESHLGHGLTVNQRGFFEAVFSNTFHVLDFDDTSGRLFIRRTIDLPHTSQYGQNVICSTNSGRLLPQKKEQSFCSLGPRVRLWHDPLLSHELMRVEPCCWVSSWTKLIGESGVSHENDESLLNDRRATLIMPFAVAGFGGDATRGLLTPGERAVGLHPHQRFPAWTFTYAPGAVMAMVRRVYELLPPQQRGVADELVEESIRTALAMTRAIQHAEQSPAWQDWAEQAKTLLKAHLESDLWQFEEGHPCRWQQEPSGRWTHPNLNRLLKLAPDMLDAQIDENQLLTQTHADLSIETQPQTASPLSFTKQDATPTTIDPTAQVADDAFVGPGCQVGPNVVIQSGVQLWNATLQACEIGQDSRIERCHLADVKVGDAVTIRSSTLTKSQIGNRSTVEAASVVDSTLAEQSTLSAFADLKNVSANYGTILGGRFTSAKIDTHLMSMHMAGQVSSIVAEPTPVTISNTQTPLDTTQDETTIFLQAIPMIGGGARCDGTEESPIRMEGCFIGSNAHILPGVRLGFGSFVLGPIGPNLQLPPFTLAFGGDPTTYRIGQVLTRLPEVILTHFLSWTYQASEPEQLTAITQLVESSIKRGLAAIRHEQARRSGENMVSPFDATKLFDLTPYTDTQLSQGHAIYETSLKSGAWRMHVESGIPKVCQFKIGEGEAPAEPQSLA